LAARIKVVERDNEDYPLKIRIGRTIYESIGDGIFIVEIDKVRGIKSKEIPDEVSLQIVKYRKKDYYEPICYTVLNTEIYYNKNGYVWVWIFQFKPRKYLKIRLSGSYFLDWNLFKRILELKLLALLRLFRASTRRSAAFLFSRTALNHRNFPSSSEPSSLGRCGLHR
jgi:hypothetical protein